MAKNILITGANSGIGYEAVKALLESTKNNYHILVAARTTEKAGSAIEALKKECPGSKNTMQPLAVDLDSDESINHAFEQVKKSPGYLDALVNNAGANYDIPHLKGEVSLRDSFMRSYSSNVAGTHVLTHTLIPLLLKSQDPRLLFITGLSAINQAGKAYFPTPPQPAGWPKPEMDFETIGYRCSKCALNMLMLDWNFKLKEDGVKVWAVGPGMNATNLGGVGVEKAREMGAQHPRAGGEFIRDVVEGERDGDTGVIVTRGGVMDW